ncbi:ASCH domain-containing protein [Weissella minor]|nr:ASCH domain-containing protein [Weissella minor]
MTPVEAYWQNFCEQNQLVDAHLYAAFGFGMSKDMQNELAQLVVDGTKRGTASALALYEDDEAKPQVGDYSIILDGDSQPVAVIQTTQVEILPFNAITEAHAKREGEGDLSLAYWQQAHIAFFEPLFKEVKQRDFKSDDLILFETFERK